MGEDPQALVGLVRHLHLLSRSQARRTAARSSGARRPRALGTGSSTGGRGLTSQLAVGAGQLRLDRQMDVAVDVIDPDAVDDPVGLQDREDLRLDPS